MVKVLVCQFCNVYLWGVKTDSCFFLMSLRTTFGTSTLIFLLNLTMCIWYLPPWVRVFITARVVSGGGFCSLFSNVSNSWCG